MGIGRQPPRSALPAPVERGDRPAPVVPMGEGFEIFLENIAAPTLKEDAAARGRRVARPVEPAQRPAIGRRPVLDDCAIRQPAPELRGPDPFPVANFWQSIPSKGN